MELEWMATFERLQDYDQVTDTIIAVNETDRLPVLGLQFNC